MLSVVALHYCNVNYHCKKHYRTGLRDRCFRNKINFNIYEHFLHFLPQRMFRKVVALHSFYNHHETLSLDRFNMCLTLGQTWRYTETIKVCILISRFTSGACTIKLLLYRKKATVFATAMHFHPSLIFVGKDGACHSGARCGTPY
jgi:hypothetical protein